jgi:hypothetical protein
MIKPAARGREQQFDGKSQRPTAYRTYSQLLPACPIQQAGRPSPDSCDHREDEEFGWNPWNCCLVGTLRL